MKTAIPDSVLALSGVDVSHAFGGGAYIKSTSIPAGTKLGQHAHTHDHLSVLVSGNVTLTVDGDDVVLDGFQVLTLHAGKTHSIHANTDAVWLCVWATDETDEQEIDRSILKE